MTKETSPDIDPEGFRRFEHAGWVEVAEHYDGCFGALTRQAIRPLLEAAGVGQGLGVLDVACGPGHLAAEAASRGARPIGVDFSSSMVAEARRLHPGLDVREGDAERLAFADGSFDAVVCAFGMLHLAEPDRAAREAFRVLRPGGRYAFSVWDRPERTVSMRLVRGAIEAHGRLDVPLPAGPDFFHLADPDTARALLANAGFASAAVTTVDLVWRVPDADALLDAFLRAGVRTRGLLLGQTDEALARIRAGLREAAAPWERDGALVLPTPCVIAAASRP